MLAAEVQARGDQADERTLAMGVRDKGYATLTPEQQHWRKSNIMKIPNTNLLHALGASERIGGRL